VKSRSVGPDGLSPTRGHRRLALILDTEASSSTHMRLTHLVIIAAAIAALSSCGDLHSGLRARLPTFPAPSHLVLVHQEETGPSSCLAGDCPSAARYYLSEQSLDVTCRDVRSAVDGWDFQPVDWDMHQGVFNACSGGVLAGERALSVSVFDADRLRAVTSAEIDPPEPRRYRSAVLISLTAL
jgi:hypothetical protein